MEGSERTDECLLTQRSTVAGGGFAGLVTFEADSSWQNDPEYTGDWTRGAMADHQKLRQLRQETRRGHKPVVVPPSEPSKERAGRTSRCAHQFRDLIRPNLH
jgi:hypothetical protein